MENLCSLEFRPKPPCLPASGLGFIPHSPWEKDVEILTWDVEIPEALGPSIPVLRAALAPQCGSKA